MNRLLWWVTTPLRKLDNAIFGDPMKPHQDLLERGAKGELTSTELDKLGAWLSTPERPDYFYRDLLHAMERMVLNSGKPEARKIGAWMRDVRIQHEAGLADAVEPELVDEMSAVFLEIHKRHHVSSADPLWGRIDAVVTRLREP